MQRVRTEIRKADYIKYNNLNERAVFHNRSSFKMCLQLFRIPVSGEVEEYGDIEETISEEVVYDIIAWIKKLAQ